MFKKKSCVLVVYTDQGPGGPSPQCMSITRPYTMVYSFPDEETYQRVMLEAEREGKTIGRKGHRSHIEVVYPDDDRCGLWEYHPVPADESPLNA